VLYLLKCVTN